MAKTWLGRTKQKFVRKIIRITLRGLIFSLGLLPRRIGTGLGGHLGGIAFYLLRRERLRALKNINIAMGATIELEQRRQIVKSSFQNLGKSLFEAVYLFQLSHSEIEKFVEIEGESCLRNAVDIGRGIIFITGHLGNWELGAAALAKRYQPTVVIAAPVYDPYVEKIIINLRQSHHIETVVRGKPEMIRSMLRVLRSGGVVVLAIDQDTRTDGVFVPFFGMEAYTPSGPAALALRTGASVVMGFSLRLPDDRHKVVITGPLELIKTGSREGDIWANTARYTQVIEQFILDHPDQWVWMHERWKTAKNN